MSSNRTPDGWPDKSLVEPPDNGRNGPVRNRTKINFGHNRPWGAVSQTDCRRIASMDSDMPRYVRVYFAALGWANRLGHAEFASGQLADIIGVPVGKYRAQGVRDAIQRAKNYGLIDLASVAHCLVFSGHHFQKTALGTNSCRVHRLNV